MTTNYESVTAAATDAIEAMAERPHTAAVCREAEVQALAAYVFFSWLQIVGRSARRKDAEKMTRLIVEML